MKSEEVNDAAVSIGELRKRVKKFCSLRDWEQFHAPKNLSMAISAEAAELMEHFLWLSEEDSHAYLDDPEKKSEVAAEMADIIIYCLQFSNMTGIDITDAVIRKMKVNEKRFPESNL